MNWREVVTPLTALAAVMALFIVGTIIGVVVLTPSSVKVSADATVIRVCRDGTLVLRNKGESQFVVIRPGAWTGWMAAQSDVCAP